MTDKIPPSLAALQRYSYSDEHGYWEDYIKVSDVAPAWSQREAALRECLKEFVYRTTCLSPMSNDGSHTCTIPSDLLERARTLLGDSHE